MGDKSQIEWTDATWNPIRGCSVVSPGCKNCYAMKQAHRFSAAGGAYEGLTQLTKNGPVWTGKVGKYILDESDAMADDGQILGKYRLWSVLEMAGYFRVSAFATVISQLRESVVLVRFASHDPDAPQPTEVVRAALNDADVQFKELKLSKVLRSQWERLLERSNADAPLSEIAILIRELHNNLLVELSSAYFLIIPADRRFVYEQPQPIFGPDTEKAFPDARRDIAAAGRCYALDEWTACVFHSMRALEFGLRWLADRAGLKPEEIAGENWKNVIDRIEKKIREMEALPKSPTKSATVQFLSEAAAQFRWFKDAWRNDVAHANVHYDEREAAPLFLHVSDFFRSISPEAAKGKP